VRAAGRSADDGDRAVKKNVAAVEFSAEPKRGLIRMLSEQFPIAVICEALGWARSAYYYSSPARDETALKQAIEAVVTEWPTYGYRRVTEQLHRKEWGVNHKRVARLMTEMDLAQPVRRRRCRTTHSEHLYPRYPNLVQDLASERPDQVWVCDMTYTARGIR
jgi:putative transposase